MNLCAFSFCRAAPGPLAILPAWLPPLPGARRSRATGAAREEKGLEFLLESFRLYGSSFDSSRIGGYVLACNTRFPGDIAQGPYLERAYTLGKEMENSRYYPSGIM